MALETAGFPPGIVEDREVFFRRIEAFPEGFLVAIEGDRIHGYICAEIWSQWPHPSDPQDEGRFDLGHDIGSWLDRDGDTLYVASMTVAPDRRGGVGRHLFARSLEYWRREFPGVRQVVLIVHEHWVAARRIYQTAGFEEVGRLPGFFRPEGGPVGTALILKKETGAE